MNDLAPAAVMRMPKPRSVVVGDAVASRGAGEPLDDLVGEFHSPSPVSTPCPQNFAVVVASRLRLMERDGKQIALQLKAFRGE